MEITPNIYTLRFAIYDSKIILNLLTKKLLVNCWWNQPLVSISSTFYVQLLHMQIPRALKDTDNLTEFLCFWDLHLFNLSLARWWNWPLVCPRGHSDVTCVKWDVKHFCQLNKLQKLLVMPTTISHLAKNIEGQIGNLDVSTFPNLVKVILKAYQTKG